MEILLGSGIIGCMFILYWSVAFPEVLIDAILFRDRRELGMNIVLTCYIIASVACVVVGFMHV